MTCSFLFDAGLPDPPMDVRVDSGPQDGTVLVTWIPVTLNITSAKEG
jgi:RIMS-binding protein 2